MVLFGEIASTDNSYIGGRNAANIPYHLRGAMVTIEGTVTSVRNNNPFTESQYLARQKMILLSPVKLAGQLYDHCWIQSNINLYNLSIGDKLFFFSKLKIYEHNGEIKWCPKFPNTNLKITRLKKPTTTYD